MPGPAGASRCSSPKGQATPLRSGTDGYGALIKLARSSDYLYGGGSGGGGGGGGGAGLPCRGPAPLAFTGNESLPVPPYCMPARTRSAEPGSEFWGSSAAEKSENVCTRDTIWMMGMKNVCTLMKRTKKCVHTNRCP